MAIVAEEHVPVHNVDDDVDNDDDDEGVGMNEGGDVPSFDDEDFMFDLEASDDDLCLFFDFDDVNEVVISPTETKGDSNILKLPFQTPTQMEEIIAKLDLTARIPP